MEEGDARRWGRLKDGWERPCNGRDCHELELGWTASVASGWLCAVAGLAGKPKPKGRGYKPLSGGEWLWEQEEGRCGYLCIAAADADTRHGRLPNDVTQLTRALIAHLSSLFLFAVSSVRSPASLISFSFSHL